MEPLRIFISHATENSTFAERLARDLRRAEADVWLDASHIGPGDFVARISEALNNRDVLVLLLSPAALHSQWVPAEVNAAIVRYQQGFMQAPVVVLAQPVSLREIPALWTTYHRIDATGAYGDALASILQVLKLTMPYAPTIPQSATPVAPSASARGQPEQRPAPLGPPPASPPVPIAPAVSRRRLLATAGAGVALLATAGGAAWVILSRDTTSAHSQSQMPGTKQYWRFQTGGSVESSPTVANGIVYVGSDDNDLYAVDATTGTELWRFQTGNAVSSTPTVANGIVYVGSEDSYVYAVDA